MARINWLLFRWRDHQEHQRAVSCSCGTAKKPTAQHWPQHAHLLHPRHPSATGKGPSADRWENWGRWSALVSLVLQIHYCLVGYSWAHMSVWQTAGLLWTWWPARCHQRLNIKNPSNELNGVHQRLALPFDIAGRLPLNTSVVSYLHPHFIFLL